MAIWGDFQGITGVTRGGRGVKKLENWGDVIYGCPLTLILFATYWRVGILKVLHKEGLFAKFLQKSLYRGSSNSTDVGANRNRTIGKTVLIEDWFSTKSGEMGQINF